MAKLVLASKSPRRRELLENLGVDFQIMTEEVEEDMTSNVVPTELAMYNALQKARALLPRLQDEDIVLAADTIVVKEGIMGKPQNQGEALEMLRSLSGRQHEVITAVAMIEWPSGKERTDYVITQVFFKALTDELINRYIASGEPMDKAGAYGIQGQAALFVEKIMGDYYNVVGLPLFKIEEMLNMYFRKSLLTDFR